MRLLFFQNCVSPHQMPYIKVLSCRHRVSLVVPTIGLDSRRALGWEESRVSSSVNLKVNPTEIEVRELLNGKDGERTVALFSGITAFPEVKKWLDISLDYDIERGIITEPPYTYRYPLWMHRLRFLLQDLRYVRHLDYVFAIGAGCVGYYRSWSHRWRVIPFAYSVEEMPDVLSSGFREGKVSLCFVGSLDKRKDMMTLLRALWLLRQEHPNAYKRYCLTVAGDGPERTALHRYVSTHRMEDCVTFVGVLPMPKARQLIAESLALVLPSRHDGWGAVVSEALLAGTTVYCSRQCGASVLIESGRGRLFDAGHPQQLAQCLWEDFDLFNNEEHTTALRKQIKDWAETHISAEAIAWRMEDGLELKRKD